MLKKFITRSVAGSVLLAAAAAATAATPTSTIQSRQAGFKEIGKAAKAILQDARASSPDVARMRANAAIVNRYARRIPGWFPKGTGPESGGKTAALPAVWADPNGFRASAGRLMAASAKLYNAAGANDIGGVKAAAGQVVETCKGCHTTFRARD